jgi:CBS domain-containing protein
MIAKDLVTGEIMPLRTSDTVAFALNVMEDNRVQHLPVVNERELLGLVAEFDLVNHPEPGDPVGNVRLSLPNAFIAEHQHVFDAMKMFTELKLTILPVVDQRNAYLGLITLPNLIRQLTIITSILNPGGIIILEMAENNYSMTEIAQIVESNDAKILDSYLTHNPESTLVQVTLKVNRVDLTPILQTFQRYNYTIRATFAEKDDLDELRERYDALMNYLSI